MKSSTKLVVLAWILSAFLSVTTLSTTAEAAVSGFSIRNSHSGRCLNAPGTNMYLTDAPCNKDIASQRWINVGSMLENRAQPFADWCVAGQGHEERALLKVCNSPETIWSVNSFRDGARVKIWNSTCGYLKVMPTVGCGRATIATSDYWYIDY